MAITSKSSLREIVADERAVAIVDKYVPGFMNNAEAMGPCMGMKFFMLIKCPQANVSKETQQALCAELDALDQ